MIINVSGTGLLFVIYDGSFITDDDRDVKRNGCYISAGIGIAYHYYEFFSIRAFVQKSTDLLDKIPFRLRRLVEEKLKQISYQEIGSLIVDFLF